MIKLILSIAGSYYSARSIRSIWLAMPVAIIISLAINILGTIIIVQFFSDIGTEEAIYGMVSGFMWYPIIAIIAFIVFRIIKKKET